MMAAGEFYARIAREFSQFYARLAREFAAMACVGGCAVQAMLMQRGFYPTQDSCAPRNALRVADKQSFRIPGRF